MKVGEKFPEPKYTMEQAVGADHDCRMSQPLIITRYGLTEYVYDDKSVAVNREGMIVGVSEGASWDPDFLKNLAGK